MLHGLRIAQGGVAEKWRGNGPLSLRERGWGEGKPQACGVLNDSAALSPCRDRKHAIVRNQDRPALRAALDVTWKCSRNLAPASVLQSSPS
jgi:hypothetical protein